MHHSPFRKNAMSTLPKAIFLTALFGLSSASPVQAAPATPSAAAAASASASASTPAAPTAPTAPAWASHADQVQHTLALDQNKSLHYQVITPKGYNPATPTPILLLLPPGAQNAAMVEAGLRYVTHAAIKHGWVVVSPEAVTGEPFYGEGKKHLLPLLAALRASHNVEGDRFHIAGISNGGRAAMLLALSAPAQCASLFVFPGVLPRELPPAAELKKLAGIPVRMHVGEKDSEGWRTGSDATFAALKAAGVDVTLTVQAGEEHVLHIGDEVIMNTLEGFRVGKK
jgi:predicted peptidase